MNTPPPSTAAAIRMHPRASTAASPQEISLQAEFLTPVPPHPLPASPLPDAALSCPSASLEAALAAVVLCGSKQAPG